MKVLWQTILFAAILASGLAQAQQQGGFIAGPYLTDVTTDSAVVAFRLDRPLSAKVRILTDAGWQQFDSPEETISHFVRITNLKPGLTYDYEVICGSGAVRTPPNDTSYQIKTACLPEKSFTFAVYGDPRPGENKTTRYQQEIVNQMMLDEPVFSLLLGDMVDDGSRMGSWQEFFNVESRLLRRTCTFPVFGDNDFAEGSGLSADFFPVLNKGYYSFEWGGVWFFGLRMLNTRWQDDFRSPDGPQYKWLEEQLARDDVQKAPFRVVFLHEPIFISRGRPSDLLRHTWAPLFEKYGVDVVFASWHLYERSINNGVTYVISGGAGAELIWMDQNGTCHSQAEARQHHFCRVDVAANAMTISAVSSDRTILDTITLTPRSPQPQTAASIERTAGRLGTQLVIAPQAAYPMVPMTFFSTDCSYCRTLLRHDLPRWAEENKVALQITYFDLMEQGVYDLFLSVGMDFGRQDMDVPAVFIGRTAIGGQEEIDKRLPQELAAFQRDPESYRRQTITPFSTVHDVQTIKQDTFSKLSFGVVLSAGLLDGINPCAFTTVILLISYLSLVGGGRRQMLLTGGLFTLAVFITYLLIGFAFFNLIRVILRGQALMTIVNALLFCIVAGFAVFSMVDCVRCLKGNVTGITLQLPNSLKDRIRQRVRDFARNQTAVLGAAFGLGVLIAGMELACTGQVYFPVITMFSQPDYRIKASLYLVSYNLAFILPLTAVFLLAAFGVTSERIGDFFRQRMAIVKLAMALLFAVMGSIILINSRWF